MSEFNPHPVVPVRRIGNQVKLIGCPFCGKKHLHGAGRSEGPDFGHRLAHCADDDLLIALRDLPLGYHLRLEG